ncbi:MAG: PIG-L family deacetylase [Dehalococcoidales bacterium]|nr:PIG-L family deacetylase [Dehalococcoidales bacterium]
MSVSPVYAMAFSPHPADNDFGFAGTAAKWIKEGKKVIYVFATNGDKASSDMNLMADELAKIRRREQDEAAEILGITEVIYLDHPDLCLEDIPPWELKKELLRLFLTYKPEVVITCDPYSQQYLNSPDHRVLGRAVMDVVWPTALAPNKYRDLIAEGLEIHRAKEMLLWAAGNYNYYSDITDTFELKMKAVWVHQSQIGPNGSAPDFYEVLKQGAKNNGKVIGTEYAEAFNRLEVLQRL